MRWVVTRAGAASLKADETAKRRDALRTLDRAGGTLVVKKRRQRRSSSICNVVDVSTLRANTNRLSVAVGCQ
jgi:hypothetical protein